MKEFLKNILLISIPSLIILVVLLEVILSFFMPLPSKPTTIFYEPTKMEKFSPESGSGVYTKGKFFQIRATWNINNEGWNSPIDYHSKPDKDIIAVIGDSYIEAYQVDMDKSYPFLLDEKLSPDKEVYAFGKSGYPLSQYLHLSRVVSKKFNPSTLVFNTVHNDFRESIDGERGERYKSMMQLMIHPDSSVTERAPYYNDHLKNLLNPGIVRRLANKSRLQRYIRHPDFLGIRPMDRLSDFMSSLTKEEGGQEIKNQSNFENNINTEKVLEMEDQIRLAVDYIIGTIRKENPDKRIIFILDAPRENIYSEVSVENSGTYWIHELMKEVTSKYNVEFINLAPLMEADYQKNGKKFNSDVDWHWNEYGHKFVSETLYNHLISSY